MKQGTAYVYKSASFGWTVWFVCGCCASGTGLATFGFRSGAEQDAREYLKDYCSKHPQVVAIEGPN